MAILHLRLVVCSVLFSYITDEAKQITVCSLYSQIKEQLNDSV